MHADRKSQIHWITIAKGLGILLVVLGHSFRDNMLTSNIICGFVYHFIYSFHMFFFFALSGITFGLSYKKYLNTPGTYLKKRTKTQFVPFLSYATLMYLCFMGACFVPAIRNALENADYKIYGFGEYWLQILRYDNPYSVHLWYLLVLFILSVFCFFWLKAFGDKIRAKGALAILFLLGYIIEPYLEVPYAVHRLFTYGIFFVFGFLIASKKENEVIVPHIPVWVTILSWGYICALSADLAYKNLIAFPHATPLQKLFLLVALFPAIVSLMNLSKRLTDNKFFTKLGMVSYPVYLLHQPFCAGFVGIVLYQVLGLPIIVVVAACIVLSFALPMFILWVTRKCRPSGKLADVLFAIR